MTTLKFIINALKLLGKTNENLSTEVDAILLAIGGIKNINHVSACVTRLRLTLFHVELVNTKALKKNGAIAVIFIDERDIQIVYGLKANNYYQLIDQRLPC